MRKSICGKPSGSREKWVHGRAHLELGRLLLQAGKPAAAISELRTAISLCEEDGDPLAAEEARSLLP